MDYRVDPWSGKISHAKGNLSPWTTITEPALWKLLGSRATITEPALWKPLGSRATVTEPACYNYWSPSA